MEKQITNKIILIEDIVHIADLIEKHNAYYKEIMHEEEKTYKEYQAKGEFYSRKLVDAKITYGLTFDNNESIQKTDEAEWFCNTLRASKSNIKGITISFYAYEGDSRESIYLEFSSKSIYISSESRDLQEHDLAHQVENYLNSLPPRLDDIVKCSNKYKIFSALCWSLPLGIVLAFVFEILCRTGVILINNHILIGAISTAIAVVIEFLGSLLLPTKMHRLYRNIKFEKYYAGWDSKYGGIYKDDIASYKNECEVCIGANSNLPDVRKNISNIYAKSKKIILVEILILLVAIILFFVI